MFKDVFAPMPSEKVLFLIDLPHDEMNDTDIWKDRRIMAQDWYNTFKKFGEEIGFTVELLEYEASGAHNAPIPEDIKDLAKKSNLVLAMTKYSATSSLLPITKAEGAITRAASMPMIEKRMEDTALRADYVKVQKYAKILEGMLNNAIGAEVTFSKGDKLYIDLRNRIALLEAGDCTKAGQFINFPSGEACIAPYEAAPDEINEFGESKTEGIWPVFYDGELVKYSVKNNRIIEIIGEGNKVEEMRTFFEENETHRNIAELGIGCNPKAIVTGNILEDEKVGLHIAYGMSSHIGGKIISDMHLDMIHVKGCPVEGTTLTLLNDDGSKIELIQKSLLRYELLK